ncbi:leucine-rich repeat-containing protein 46 [Rhynchocyon petersi]
MPGTNLVPSPEEGGICITEELITKRNLTFPEDEDLSENMFHTLAELQTVRLDREGITCIRNLESLQSIHSLYLQSNKIQKIENLDCIPSLRFLSLAGNCIKQVGNLLGLPHLQFLDLSENLIETLKLDEFPQSLLILNLTGNGCTKQNGYREQVTGALPLLLDLDGKPVPERWASDEEEKTSSDEDDDHEEFPELSGPFCSEQGFLKDLEEEITRHKERRQQAALTEHLLRMETQLALTALPLLSEKPMAGDTNAPGSPGQGKKTTTQAISSPQTCSVTKKSSSLDSLSRQGIAQSRKEATVSTAPKATAPKTPLTQGPRTTKTTTNKIKK